MRFPVLFLFLFVSLLSAQEPGAAEKELAAITEALVKTPDSVPLLSRRGDSNLFAGHFAEAVADFEKMIAIDPTQDMPHWRLGIAYYFAGNFEKSSRQFEKYHTYDGHDRENGIWKFLADARQEGIEKARTKMLAYSAFDREPFPSLYEMLAGRKSGGEVLAEIEKKGLTNNPSVEFFAHYYIGLNEELLGRRDEAKEHLKKAVATYEGRRPGSSASYMWQVAKLHAAALKAPGAEKK